MFFESKIDICNLNFLKKYNVGITYSGELTDNSFTLDTSSNIITHKKVSTTGSQYFVLPLEKLQKGDVVEIELDYLLEQGVSANIVFKQNNAIVENFKLPSAPYFSNNKFKFIIKNDIGNYTGKDRIEVGYATSETGQYKIKDFVYRILRKKDVNINNIVRGMFYKTTDNDWGFHSGFANTYNNLTYEKVGNILRLKFDASTIRPIVSLTPLGLANTFDYDYRIVGIQNSYIDFQVWDKTTKAQVALDTLTSKEIWLSFIIICN